MDHKEEIKKVYDDWADKYDEHAAFNIAIIKIHPVVLDLLKKEPKKAVGLDLGCGTGILTIAASEFSKEIIGLDYSEGMLEKARVKKSLGAELKFIHHDLNKKLPFDKDTFDFVFSILTLHHLDNLEKIFIEVSRVLKPGGFFIFDEFVTNNQTPEQLAHPFGVNYPDVLGAARERGVKIWRIRSIEEYKKLTQDNSLVIEKIIDVHCDEEIKKYIVNYNYHHNRVIAKIIFVRKGFV